MDVVVVVVVVMVPPTSIIPLLVFGYLVPCFRTLGTLVELVGSSDIAWAVERAFGVGEVAPLLAVTGLAAQGAWVWVAPMLSGVLVCLPALPLLAAGAPAESLVMAAWPLDDSSFSGFGVGDSDGRWIGPGVWGNAEGWVIAGNKGHGVVEEARVLEVVSAVLHLLHLYTGFVVYLVLLLLDMNQLSL
jgi:hypothetical protein